MATASTFKTFVAVWTISNKLLLQLMLLREQVLENAEIMRRVECYGPEKKNF